MWKARASGWLPWLRAEVVLDGSSLRLRTGTTTHVLALDDPACRVSLHAWGLMRGTAVRIQTSTDAITFACEGQLEQQTGCVAPLHGRPDVRLDRSDLEALLAALPRPTPLDTTRKELWLWRNPGRPTVAIFRALRVMFMLLVASMANLLMPWPWGMMLMLGVVAAGVGLEARTLRRADAPALCLVVGAGQVMLARENRDVVGRWPVATLEVRTARWQFSGHSDAPALVIRGVWARSLTIGAAGILATAGRERVWPPHYLVSPPCWQALVLALTEAPSARSADGSIYRSSRRSSPSRARPRA